MSKMTSRAIVDLISKPPTRLSQGKAAYVTAGRSGRPSAERATPKQEAFATAYANMQLPDTQIHRHPAAGPLPRREPGPLTPVELQWLGRFPSPVDPAAVTFEDAQALASMDSGVSALQHPADSRLLRSVWAPVRDHHDAKHAEAAIANATRPLPSLPSSTLGALADAIAAENDQLTPEEAVSRAGVMLREASIKREQARQAAIDAAHELQMKVDAHVHERTTVSG